MANGQNYRIVHPDFPEDNDFFRSQTDNNKPDNGLTDESEDVGRSGSTQIGGLRTTAIPTATGPSVADASLNLGTGGSSQGQLMRNGSPINYQHGACRLPSNPTTDNTIHIFTLTDTGGVLAANHRISISYGQPSHSLAKYYVMSWQYNQHPTGVNVQPITSTGAFGTNSDFELIAKVLTNRVEYYIRRTLGTDGNGQNRIPLSVYIESTTDYSETLEVPCETITDNTVYPLKKLPTPCLTEQKIEATANVGSSTIDAAADICYVQMSPATIYTLSIPAGTSERCQVIVKRTDNNINSTLRVQSTSGIDGAPSNRISLGSTSVFGSRTGESVTLKWSFVDSTWRII